MSPDLAQGLGDCAGVLHGLDVGRPGSISVICDLIATPIYIVQTSDKRSAFYLLLNTSLEFYVASV